MTLEALSTEPDPLGAFYPDLPTPGVYDGVPFAEYLTWPYVNNSSLGPLNKSPAHYRSAKESERADTDAFRLGRLAHCTALEIHRIGEVYVVEPDHTEGKELEQGLEGDGHDQSFVPLARRDMSCTEQDGKQG